MLITSPTDTAGLLYNTLLHTKYTRFFYELKNKKKKKQNKTKPCVYSIQQVVYINN